MDRRKFIGMAGVSIACGLCRPAFAGFAQSGAAGNWQVEIRLPKAERSRVKEIKVNGVAQAASGSGPMQFKGKSQPGKALRWEVFLA
jgi:hypothetical protein